MLENVRKMLRKCLQMIETKNRNFRRPVKFTRWYMFFFKIMSLRAKNSPTKVPYEPGGIYELRGKKIITWVRDLPKTIPTISRNQKIR